MGLQTLKPGELGTIVTYLDMRARPKPALPLSSPLRLNRWTPADLEKYRMLFTRVGGPWLWFSRLTLSDEALRAIVEDPGIEIFTVEDPGGIEVGMLELDFRAPDDCEISYIGLVPGLAGKGHDNWLIAEALIRAWKPDTRRVHLHSCTLDHPAALRFYQNSGFAVRGQAIETFPDPRLKGLLPQDCAPQIPLRSD